VISSNSEKQDSFNIPSPQPIEASGDQKAESEAAALAFNLPLESAKTARKLAALSNKEKLDGTVNNVLRKFIWVAFCFAVISFGVLFWNMLAPASLLFLSSERLASLRELLFSGAFGAGLAALWQSQSRREDDL
jgi:hypothetical protein